MCMFKSEQTVDFHLYSIYACFQGAGEEDCHEAPHGVNRGRPRDKQVFAQ